MVKRTIISKCVFFFLLNDHATQECHEANQLVVKIPPPTLKAIFKNKDHPSISPNKKNLINKSHFF